MKRKIIFLIINFSIIIFVILYINVFSSSKSTIVKQDIFYNISINKIIKEDVSIGYNFVIDSVKYVPGEFTYCIETFTNDERLKTLNQNLFSNNKKKIVFSWRDTEPPFQLTKEEKADTLYIVKNGFKFSFPKVNFPQN